MRLTGKVVATYSGERFTDGKRRVEIRVAEADSVSNDIRIPDDTFQLDDQVTIFVIPGEVQEVPTTYDQAMSIIDESVRRAQEANMEPPKKQNVVTIGGGDAS